MFKINNKNTYFTPFSSVSIVDFAQVNISWAFYISLPLGKYLFQFNNKSTSKMSMVAVCSLHFYKGQTFSYWHVFIAVQAINLPQASNERFFV